MGNVLNKELYWEQELVIALFSVIVYLVLFQVITVKLTSKKTVALPVLVYTTGPASKSTMAMASLVTVQKVTKGHGAR